MKAATEAAEAKSKATTKTKAGKTKVVYENNVSYT